MDEYCASAFHECLAWKPWPCASSMCTGSAPVSRRSVFGVISTFMTALLDLLRSHCSRRWRPIVRFHSCRRRDLPDLERLANGRCLEQCLYREEWGPLHAQVLENAARSKAPGSHQATARHARAMSVIRKPTPLPPGATWGTTRNSRWNKDFTAHLPGIAPAKAWPSLRAVLPERRLVFSVARGPRQPPH